ncbi:alanine racemase [Flammeovirgaceae bacterium SG7u.111]|nr:alanine racemase [Flammeovirgaceae bacterium SG7u.132]WPO33079.1 alanine racemase [Flammeovirgaceae bacterium SG7u.111]
MSLKITKPTLLLDKQKCFRNIENMVRKANKHNVRLRPHFKTHQSAEVGQWFKDFGVSHITVSSVDMAKYFAENGWENILIAFPINPLQFDEIEQIPESVNLELLLSDAGILPHLSTLKRKVGIFIEFNAGYGRTGFSIDQFDEIKKCLDNIVFQSNLTFSGFYTHNGHTYSTQSIAEINQIHIESIRLFRELRAGFRDEFPQMKIVMGDTPSCSTMDFFQYIDEIGPGNFVFYDLTQQKIGSCEFDQVAVAMACPVVAKFPEKGEVVIYGGGVHFSKDILEKNGEPIFGLMVEQTGKNWGQPIEGAYIKGLSQEHGKVVLPKELFDNTEIGDILYFLPVHSCLTANLMREYLTLEGEVVGRM